MNNTMIKSSTFLNKLKKIPLNASDVTCLLATTLFKPELLSQIKKAKKRIYLAALYLEADDGGAEILEALYLAKKETPSLHIYIFVDYHRAQRGLIGEKHTKNTNATWYQSFEKSGKFGVNIIGIPVKSKEVFGVQHMKGFVFDDIVFYSGASLNDTYLKQHHRYRYDRYWLINSKSLADSIINFFDTEILSNSCIAPFNVENIKTLKELKPFQWKFTQSLKKASFKFDENIDQLNSNLAVTPLCGLGAKNNVLNDVIINLLESTQQQAVIFTPYFNLDKSIARAFEQLLKRGCNLTIIVGDKVANDFYIADENKFSTIGALPYLYELNLKCFCKKHNSNLASGQLDVRLWLDEENSFHLKGMSCDNRYVLITGHNLNPRAWRQDLENGLLFDDPKQVLKPFLDEELSTILKNTKKITHSGQIESLMHYPIKVQKIINRMRRVYVDKLIKRII
ncbi:MAG: CDP-diacylglycerol--serine O-phosphatidyltransferase [Psychromonas sp.]|nr:CDP-diacylglycerol--serine O-phosphatidyltransferase [Psychromonas sp.]